MKFWKYSINGYVLILLADFMNLTQEQIKGLCSPCFGIAARGIVMMRSNGQIVEVVHYDEQGKKSTLNLNALRCVAQLLLKQQNVDEVSVIQENQLYLCKKKVDGIEITVPIPKQIEKNIYQLGNYHRLFMMGILDKEEKRFCTHLLRYYDSKSFSIESAEMGLGKVQDSGEGQVVAYYHGLIHCDLGVEVMAIGQGGRSSLKYKEQSISICSRVDCIYEANYLKML